MLVIMLVTLLEGGAVNHLPIPTWGYFLIALGALIAGLEIVRGIGKNRPHS